MSMKEQWVHLNLIRNVEDVLSTNLYQYMQKNHQPRVDIHTKWPTGLPAPQINKFPWLFPDFSLTKLGFSLTKTTKFKRPPPPLQPSNPPISFSLSFFQQKSITYYWTKKCFLHLNKLWLFCVQWNIHKTTQIKQTHLTRFYQCFLDNWQN